MTIRKILEVLHISVPVIGKKFFGHIARRSKRRAVLRLRHRWVSILILSMNNITPPRFTITPTGFSLITTIGERHALALFLSRIAQSKNCFITKVALATRCRAERFSSRFTQPRTAQPVCSIQRGTSQAILTMACRHPLETQQTAMY